MLCPCVRALILKDPLKFLLATLWLWLPNSLSPASSLSMFVHFPKLNQTRSVAENTFHCHYVTAHIMHFSLKTTECVQYKVLLNMLGCAFLFYCILFCLGKWVAVYRHHQRTCPCCLVWSLCWFKVSAYS